MKSMTAILVAFFFASVTSNAVFANDSTSVLPKHRNEPVQPAKLTSCNELNQFVAQCFDMHNTIRNARLQMKTIYASLSTLKLSEAGTLLAQVKEGGKNMTDLLPQVEKLLTAAPDMVSKAKRELPVLEYLRAFSNLTAAAKAVKLSYEDVKYMVTTTVPALKSLLADKKRSETANSDAVASTLVAEP